jgi:uncharacterized protein
MNSSALIIMAKEPQVGATKTRLCPPLTLADAAKLYEVLLWDTIKMVSDISDIDLAIAITPPESTTYFQQISPEGTQLIPVGCADIGECLTYVLGKLLAIGYKRVIALNSDGPSLPPEYIYQAEQSLDHHDLVFGPAEDGGYYLVGFKEMYVEIFSGIEWSTPQVLLQTLQKVTALGLSVQLLPPWYDIDTAEDIERLQAELQILSPETLPHTRKFLTQWTPQNVA